MFKDSEEFRKAANELLELAEKNERGEYPTHKLLYDWKIFYREGSEYIEELKKVVDSNPNWS